MLHLLIENNRYKSVIFKKYALFINCTSEMNNTHVDDVHDVDVVMPIYNLM